MKTLRTSIAWLLDRLIAGLGYINAAIRPADGIVDPARNGGSGEER